LVFCSFHQKISLSSACRVSHLKITLKVSWKELCEPNEMQIGCERERFATSGAQTTNCCVLLIKMNPESTFQCSAAQNPSSFPLSSCHKAGQNLYASAFPYIHACVHAKASAQCHKHELNQLFCPIACLSHTHTTERGAFPNLITNALCWCVCMR
jgi:hypothetical protein